MLSQFIRNCFGGARPGFEPDLPRSRANRDYKGEDETAEDNPGAKEKGCDSEIVVGGAGINESFADEIGADGYSKDAADCVKLVDRLLEE